MVCQRGIQGRRVVHMVPHKRRMVCKDLWGPQMGSQMGSISVYRGVSNYSQVSKIAIFGLFGDI